MSRCTTVLQAAVLSAFVVFGPAAGRGLAEEAAPPGVLAESLLRTLREDPSSIVGMSEADLIQTCQTLVGTGDRETAGLVCAVWVEGSDKYKSSSMDTLCQLATFSRMAAEVGQPAVQLMTGHVQEAYLAQPGATRSATLGQWQALAGVLADTLSEGTRAFWVEGLRTAFVEDGETLAGLKLTDVQALSGALTALGDKRAYVPLAVWVQNTTTWQFLKLNDLVWNVAARLPTDTPEGRAARECLVAHIESAYMADAEALRSVGGGMWKELVGRVVEGLSDERRAEWVARLRGACVEDPGALAAMKLGDVQALSAALKSLGDKEADAVAATWVETTSAWQEYAPNALASLANVLSAAGDAGCSARQRLAAHVQQRYLSTSAGARELGIAGWSELTGRLTEDLTGESRIEWAQRIRDAYGGSEAVLVGLNIEELEALCKALETLGDAHGPSMVARYVERSTEWRLRGKPADLLRLMQLLPGPEANLKAARLRVAAFLADAYLADPQKAHELGVKFWQKVAQLVGEDLSPEDCRAWFERIRGTFLETDDAMAAMKAAEFDALVKSVAALDKKEAAGLVLSWLRLKEGQVARQAAPAALAVLVLLLAEQDPEPLKPLMDAIEQHFLAADGRKPLNLVTIWHLMRIQFAVGNPDKAQAWVRRTYAVRLGTQAARNSIDPATLEGLAGLMVSAGLTGKGKGYVEFAAALATRAREGNLASGSEELAAPLGTPEARQILEDALIVFVNSQENPRLGVAKTLAWAYRNVGELDAWRQFLEGKVGSSEGDTKALWLAAKAYTMTLLPDPPNPLRRKQGLEDALAAALSEPVRLTVLREFADYYRAISRPAVGALMLQSLKHQFSGEAAETIGALQAGLQDAEAARQAGDTRAQSAAEVVRSGAQLKYYQACLEQVRTEGEQEEVARLQEAIQELEQKVDQ
jgi:hypothetical protein